jgi:hypothetical protein
VAKEQDKDRRAEHDLVNTWSATLRVRKGNAWRNSGAGGTGAICKTIWQRFGSGETVAISPLLPS